MSNHVKGMGKAFLATFALAGLVVYLYTIGADGVVAIALIVVGCVLFVGYFSRKE